MSCSGGTEAARETEELVLLDSPRVCRGEWGRSIVWEVSEAGERVVYARRG